MSLQNLNDIGLKSTNIRQFTYQMPIDVVEQESFCDNITLEIVKIPDAASIDDYTFQNCSSLQELELPGVATYDSSLFGDSKPPYIRKISISEGTTHIGSLLSGLSSLTDVHLPNTFTHLESGALDKCYNLTSLNVARNCEFSELQFRDTKSLSSLEIRLPINNKDIGLSGLRSNSSISAYLDSILLALNNKLFGGSQCSSITFGGDTACTIKELEDNSFLNCRNLISIDLSLQGIMTIPVSAFANCIKLSNIVFPSSVRKFSKDCFINCYSLSVDLPATLTSIDSVGLTLADVEIPENIQNIGPSAFMNSTFSNKDIELLSLTSVGDYAFSYSDIQSAKFGSSVTSIASCMFMNSSLSSFDFTSIREVGEMSFSNTSLSSSSESMLMMGNIDKYGANSFTNIYRDLYMKMSPNITSYGNFTTGVFSGSYVKGIQLTSLTNAQFDNLSTLAGGSLIPESKYSEDVKVVYQRIKTMLGSATDFTLELADITFDKDGELAEYECLLYDDAERKHLSKCDITKSDYSQFIAHPLLPSRVSAIGANAFKDLTGLTALNIKNVTTVEQNAFSGCSNVRSLTSDQLMHIGDYSFNNCTSLSSLNAPQLLDVGQLAFNGCTSLQKMSIPKMQTAGDSAFYGCTSLLSAIAPELTVVRTNLFNGCSNLEVASTPKAENIGQYSFNSCTSLTSVNIGGSESIGSYAFKDCDSLEFVSLPAELTSIGDRPFDSCESLDTLQINGSVINIPNDIADGIPNVLAIYIPHSSMSDIKDNVASNRFATKVKSEFYTSDKRSIYPSLITKTASQVIPITNGLIVDPESLKVIGTDSTYNLWSVYESDLNDLNGIEDGAFQGSKIQTLQLPTSWGDATNKWDSVGSNIFNGSTIQYVRVGRDYNSSTDPVLYIKLFASCTSSPYIRFTNGSLVSSTKFVGDTDQFIYDATGEWIIGVVDENISATGGATVKTTTSGISARAFADSKYLKALDVADRTRCTRCLSVIDDAFAGARTLSTVVFDSAAQLSIFDHAFRSSYVNTVKVPGFLSVGGYGLQESYKLRILEYSDETLEILPSAMMDCKPLLANVLFSDESQLTGIGDYAFAEIDDPFPNIEEIDFRNCSNLSSIGKYAFYNSIQSTTDRVLNFPNSITSIADAAFAYRKGYKEYHKISALDLSSSNIKDIGPSAFYYNSFRNVNFGDKLSSIGQYAFAKSTYKYNVYIPSSISSIGWKAFKDNVILNPDRLSYNVMSVDTTLEKLSTVIGLDSSSPLLSVNNKFQAVTNTIGISRNTVLSALRSDYLSGFIVASAPDSNPRNSLLNFCPSNMKIDLMNRRIVRCDNSLNYAYIPNYVTSSSPSAFMNCTNINMLCDFYDNKTYMLSNVEDYEFSGCTNLSNIQLLSTATHIGTHAFADCSKISSIYGDVDDEKFPYFKLQSIGPSAFMNCSSMKKFNMCNSVSSISVNMFDNCPLLEDIFIDMTAEEFNLKFAPTPSSTIKQTIIHYFSGIKTTSLCKIDFNDAVYTHDGNIWLDDALIRIRKYGKNNSLNAISGIVYDSSAHPLSGQTYLNLSSISMIDKYVFDGVGTLKNINIIQNEDTKEYLSSIGEYAFYNCSKLNSINGCKLSCEDVGQYAFGKCKLLLDMQFDLSKLSSIGQGAFYKTNLNNLTFVDPSRSDINAAREAVVKSIGFNSAGDRNPLQLPEGCMINIKLKDGSSYQFNYLMDDLSSTVIDINRHAIVFTDKTTSSVKPLVLVEATSSESVPAIVANTYHASIIGRWK